MIQQEQKIVYCVVAETVQHPLKFSGVTNSVYGGVHIIDANHILRTRTAETRTIVQVPGRLAAQVAHVVSKMRYSELVHEVEALMKLSKNRKRVLPIPPFEPITTIILGARDSFELEHVYNLLRDVADIWTYKFDDTNPEVYGEGEVITAIATVPVLRQQVLGILDYLPLWTPS